MVNYPKLKKPKSRREVLEVFKGYNRNLRIDEGEFREMENLTGDHYPVMTTRKKRGWMRASKYLPGEGRITGAYYSEKFGPMLTRGKYLYDYSGGLSLDLNLDDQPKRLVTMGRYMIILPDMKYVNLDWPQDCGPLGHLVEVTEGEVTCTPCTLEGEALEPVVAAVAPEAPEEGVMWIDTSATPHVLKTYASATDTWVTVATTYVKISGLNYGTDGEFFRQYDGVTISGLDGAASHLNGSAILQSESSSKSIIITGLLDEVVTQVCTAEKPVRVERRIPIMDHVIEAGNRLWGCRYGRNLDGEFVNEIYCSKLGDFRNWNCFMGIATDSWVGSLGSQEPFTGAVNLGGNPVFYKQDRKHKVWISDSGAHQITENPCQGVKSGCGGSVATMDGVAIYKSARGFCMDDGSGTVEIGQCFAGAEYSDAIAGVFGHKYYVSMRNTDGCHLFVYDADRKLWHREDDLQVLGFVDNGIFLTAVCEDCLLDLTSGEQRQQMEDTVRWSAETGELGLSSPDMKYISRLILRLSMEPGAELTVFGQYDMETEWVALFSIRGSSLRSFSLPVRPRRCDHLRLRLEGEGDVKIYSITKVIEEGSDIS